MRTLGILALVFLTAAAGPASARSSFSAPDPCTVVQTEHQIVLRHAESQPQPYAMSYTDEVAQSLGVRNGQWEAFSAHSNDPLMPSLKGGVDSGRPMLSLQWRQ